MAFFIWIGATSGVLKRIPQEKPSRFLHHPSFLSPTKLAVSQLNSINLNGEGADQAPRYWKWWSLLSCWDPQRWKQKIERPLKRLEFFWNSDWKVVPMNGGMCLWMLRMWDQHKVNIRATCVPTRGLCGTCGQARVIRVEETWWAEEFEQTSCLLQKYPVFPR